MRVLIACVVLLAFAPASLAQERSIATSGNPASLVVYGDAEAIGTLADGTVLAARVEAGKGRVVAIGHGGFLNDHRGDTQAFLDEQVLWLLDGKRQATAWGMPDAMREALGFAHVAIVGVGGEIGGLALDEVDLIIASPQAFERAGRLEELARWLAAGGALLSVETAWGQIQLGQATGVDDLAANKLLGTYGIFYTNRALSPGRDGVYTLDPHASGHAGQALTVLARQAEASSQDAIQRSARVLRQALAVVPLDSPLIAAVDEAAERESVAVHEAYASMATGPLKLADRPLACALLDLEARRATSGQVRAHPSAAAFPGSIPDGAERVTRRIDLRTIGGWRSTGLYAAPGETIMLRVVEGDTPATLRIGCWLDPQDFDDRVRFPVASFTVPVESGAAALASPIGGPVYVELPDQPDELVVEVTGAVEMPRYRLGETDLEDWRDRVRHLSAPWVELESDHLAFSLPASVVRDLDRPDLVMQHWDRVHEAMQALEPRSPRHWPKRQYRYVAEKRLSWGYMYCPSDAPIVIPLSEAAAMVDVANFDADGPNELWGHYHEMGHAHQNPLWTFAGTGEVTVNIFTVLALHTINGYPLDSEAMRSDPGRALAAMHAHADKGAPFHRWQSDPFLALQTYALLWHAFGFEAFDRAFRSYESLSEHQKPRDDQAKRDRFAIQMSRAVGHNLAPYFTAWGVPLTEAPSKDLADFPAWMPEGYEPSSR